MPHKRLLLSGLAVLVFIFIYEWIFHGVLLKDLYESTPELWRTQEEMSDYFGWLSAGQVLLAVFFCGLFSFAQIEPTPGKGALYGLWVGLLLSSTNVIMYAVQPFPLALLGFWILGGTLELILAGALLGGIYQKPAQDPS